MEHVLETRLLLRYATYTDWMNSDLILKKGEPAIVSFPGQRVIDELSNTTAQNTPPAIGIKIGDGIRKFARLPWIQGIAADVYSWAKSSAKPTYSASEITGLDTYVQNLIEENVEEPEKVRYYQLAKGTGRNANRYYLQYHDSGVDTWTTDFTHYIDMADINTIVEWIGDDVDTYASLANRTEQHIQYDLGLINVSDSPVEHQVVTSVSQTATAINVTRRQLAFDDISGTVPISQGGTGATSFTQGEVLIGNGENAWLSRAIADTIDTSNALVPSNLIKQYVDNAVAGLAQAMHFRGVAQSGIEQGSTQDPKVPGFDFKNIVAGDVVIFDAQEYIWTGSYWHLLGDEGSYAVKGSIIDSDIAANANIAQSKIAGLGDSLAGKVDVVDGKQLSTNDYTNDDKTKLNNIETGAQVNIIEHILLNGIELEPYDAGGYEKIVSIMVKEFDDASKTKLDGIDTGAQVNAIEHIYVDGVEQEINNKSIMLVTDAHTEHENIIEEIYLNGVKQEPDEDKHIHLIISQQSLGIVTITGAILPDRTKVSINDDDELELAQIAASGNVKDLVQTTDTYIILNCGTSTTVI